MTPGEVVKELLNERSACLSRVQAIEHELIELMIDQKMYEFFTINWRKLHKQFIVLADSPITKRR